MKVLNIAQPNAHKVIFKGKNGQLMGVEYEVMLSFVQYVRKQYGIELTVNWVDAQGFDKIIPFLRTTQSKGVFGIAYFSITEERKQFVKFTPPYMPDLNVLVTHTNLPSYANDSNFGSDLKNLNAYTMANTTMAQDLQALQQRFYPPLHINATLPNDYEVLEKISQDEKAFGYLPLSIYIVGLQKGIKVKRQSVLTTQRPGFAAVYPLHSDWDEPLVAYFNSIECRLKTERIIRKYLGKQMASLVFDLTKRDSLPSDKNDLELLTLEKEIVTQRLLDSALEVQNQKIFRNAMLVGTALVLALVGLLFARYRTRQRFTQQLLKQNEVISVQKQEIEQANHQLEMRILQAQMSPYFIANSLRRVRTLVEQGQEQKALNYLGNLETFSEMILKNTETPTNTVANELKLLQHYLDLERTRLTEGFDFRVDTDESTEILEAHVPSFLIRPFIEKAIEYSTSSPNEIGFLHLQFSRRGKKLVLKLQYNGYNAQPMDQLLRTRIDTLLKQGKTIETELIPLKNLQGELIGTQQEISMPLE